MTIRVGCLRHARLALALTASLAPTSPAAAAGDRLLATGGVIQIEGAAGGGLTPWALIAGLGTSDEIGASGACTHVAPQDFTLDSCGVAVGVYNRVELSVGRQHLDLGTTAPGSTISQTIVGAKLRLSGDAMVDQDRWWPQLAFGLQAKHNSDFDGVPKLLGARHANGIDYYLAATKVWLAGPFGRSWLTDLTVRGTQANQMGLLGFGGDRGGYHVMGEASLGAFLTDNLLLGVEYRQKPNDLSAFREQDYRDFFIAYFPVKYLSVTGAYADLGNIADKPAQRGPYISLQLSW